MTVETRALAFAVIKPPLHRHPRLKPGPGQSRLDVVANQRARLQRAMVDLAAQDGCGAVTVRKLTKLAGVSNETFYSRFLGTDDCLLVAYGAIMDEASRRVAATRSARLGSAEQVDCALRALLGYLLADPSVARFTLVEIYGGGPAALAAIAAEDARLEKALRGCLNRRSRRAPKGMAEAIVAASLHCARSRLLGACPNQRMQNIDGLVEWARDVVEGQNGARIPDGDLSRRAVAEPTWAMGAAARDGSDEEDLILTAVLRLAEPDGYFSLTPTRVSSASGVSAARYRRHFASIEDGYLAAVRRTCRAFFVELTSPASPDCTEQPPTPRALQRALSRAAAYPAAARLTFGQIVEPGIAGVTCRDALISDLATAWNAATPAPLRSRPVRADARAAALWASLAAAGRPPHSRVT